MQDPETNPQTGPIFAAPLVPAIIAVRHSVSQSVWGSDAACPCALRPMYASLHVQSAPPDSPPVHCARYEKAGEVDAQEGFEAQTFACVCVSVSIMYQHVFQHLCAKLIKYALRLYG